MGLILILAETAYVYGVACGQALGELGLARLISSVM